MDIDNIERLVDVLEKLVEIQNDMKLSDVYETSYAIQEVAKTIKAELLKRE